MEPAELIKVLEGVGLPEKAASIYVSLLGKSRMDVADISRATNIKRATCYEHLDLLLSKDFVVRVPIGKRTLYSANEPEKILHDFKKKTAEFEKTVEAMATLHERSTNKPKVTFHEGKREIKKIYDEVFTTIGDIYSIFPPDPFFETYTLEEYDAYDKENLGHALRIRDLVLKSPYNKKIDAIRKKNRGGTSANEKRLPEEFKSNVDVLIYNNTVALVSLRDLSSVVIENPDIAELFKSMHTFMWKRL